MRDQPLRRSLPEDQRHPLQRENVLEFDEVRRSLEAEAEAPLVRVDPKRDGPISIGTLRSF